MAKRKSRAHYTRKWRKSAPVLGDGGRRCFTCQKSMGESAHANRKYCSPKCKDRAGTVAKYGITVVEYDLILNMYERLCPICNRKVKKWQIDHNHQTHETYGPVCTTCNLHLLAYTYHNPEIAKRLVKFLEEPPVRQLFGERFVTEAKSKEKSNFKRFKVA